MTVGRRYTENHGCLGLRQAWRRLRRPLAVSFLVCTSLFSLASAQKRKGAEPKNQPANELAKLREDFVNKTKEYKASLERLVALYEQNVRKAEEKASQARELFKQGLISRNQLDESEAAVANARDMVNEKRRDMATADAQIAETLLEAQAEVQMAKLPGRKGSLVTTTAYIRYNGTANWGLPDAWKVQRFFTDTFKKPLPIAVFGQGAIHDRWRLDHHNAMDISLHPDGVEGQALINFLRNNGIPFLAFRAAIPGTATGPHIHIGRPSHRF
jgi:hypothetical protein